jgi:hypothetical protein
MINALSLILAIAAERGPDAWRQIRWPAGAAGHRVA